MAAILDFFTIPKKRASAQGHTPTSSLISRNSYERFLRSDVERTDKHTNKQTHKQTDSPRFKISPLQVPGPGTIFSTDI